MKKSNRRLWNLGVLLLLMLTCSDAVNLMRVVETYSTIDDHISKTFEKPDLSLLELSLLVEQGVENFRKHLAELENEGNFENSDPSGNTAVALLETETELMGANKPFIRFVRKSYFFLLMYFPNMMRIFHVTRKLVNKYRPPPKEPPSEPRIYLQLESGSDLEHVTEHIDEDQEAFMRIHKNIISLLELAATRRRRRRRGGGGFYEWLCHVLVWIYRWMRFYAKFWNRNFFRVRCWITDNKIDDISFVFRPQWSLEERWEKFLRCHGDLDCLYPRSPISGASSGTSGVPGSSTAAASGSSDGSSSQVMSGAGMAGASVIDGDDDEVKVTVEPFDFTDCLRYDDCAEELNVTMLNYNGTYPIDPSSNSTISNSTEPSTNPNPPALTQIFVGQNLSVDTKKKQQKQQQQNQSGNSRNSQKDEEYSNEDTEDATKSQATFPIVRDMERKLVHSLVEADMQVHDDMMSPALEDSPKRGITDDAENDGGGEPKHILAGMPRDLFSELPAVMQWEETHTLTSSSLLQGSKGKSKTKSNAKSSKKTEGLFDDIRAATALTKAELEDHIVRPK